MTIPSVPKNRPVMHPDAKPSRLAVTFIPGDVKTATHHRMTSCKRYDDCLTFVVCSHWDNFSCRACPLFKEEAAPVMSVDEMVDHVVQSLFEED